MCPLALIAGFVDAIAGGGGLISLPAYFFAGLPPHAAIATNKLSSTLGTLVATVRYALFGYMVKRFVVAGVACGLVGSAIGANLALLADATVLTVVMLVALPPVAFLVFRSKNLDRFAEHPCPRAWPLRPRPSSLWRWACTTGSTGRGRAPSSCCCSPRWLIRTCARPPALPRRSTWPPTSPPWRCFSSTVRCSSRLGLAAAAFNIAGNWLGSTFFDKKGALILRPIMLVVIVLFAIRLVTDLLA